MRGGRSAELRDTVGATLAAARRLTDPDRAAARRLTDPDRAAALADSARAALTPGLRTAPAPSPQPR
ncbi:hypothetical protein ACIQNG_12065 [Streptomyces sp. NPDC091377]|uniref:hypothetical protein n=1 Tax=Streptomyces sp. NPDC091377 TaxID=3365995 RepID=UPI00380D5BA4